MFISRKRIRFLKRRITFGGKEKLKKSLKWYLVGPIQWEEDFMSWREEIREFLEKCGHEALLPWGEIYHGKRGRAVFSEWAKTMSKDDFLGRVRKYMRRFVIKWDLKEVEAADGIIFFLPKDVATVGSYGEETLIYYLAYHKKLAKWKASHKKILVVTDIPVEELSYWMIGCSDRVFFGWKSFKDWFIRHFDNIKKGKEK